MKTKIAAVVLALTTCAIQSPAFTLTGTEFTYQGRLNDGSGPANGTYDLLFTVYDSTNQPGVVIAGPLTNAATSVSNGLFTVTLDFGPNVFNLAERWLEIGARTNGATTFITVAPRQRFDPAPYAITAENAGNLLGTLSALQLPPIVVTNGQSGVNLAGSFTGNGSNLASLNAANISSGALPDARLSTNVALRAGGNTFTNAQLFYGPVYLNTTDGFDQSSVGNFLIDAPYIPGGRLAVMTNGNVGINNPSPQYTLDVGGTVNLPQPATIYSGGNWMLRVDQYGNFFAGLLAGNLTISNYFNVGVGYGALYYDTTGGYNTAIGAEALVSNTTGTNNTASGALALYSNTNGSANTASGAQALYSNLYGWGNTANGDHALYSSTGGYYNTATGAGALFLNTVGVGNNADGFQALYNNMTGADNSATGYKALYGNIGGIRNVADGEFALFSNTSGSNNTAMGYGAFYSNVLGSNNTAVGYEALYSETNGVRDTAIGYLALASELGGIDNTALGYLALSSDTWGGLNTASGGSALLRNTTGSYNTADGLAALGSNVGGNFNVAVGSLALDSCTSGSWNIALGQDTGNHITTGTNNICIGFSGSGYANESNVIRIGTEQTEAFIAGITGTPVSGSAVTVNIFGQLGVAPSSQRFKQNIQTMGDTSEVLLALQPVKFQYKPDIDPQGLAQFGLIAEQVEKVDPDLVVHDKQHGIFTVRYEAVNAMLLNEFLKQHKTVVEENAQIQQLQHTVAELQRRDSDEAQLKQENQALERRLERLEQWMASKEPSDE